MAAFNLTAEINLRGPSNLNQVVSNIKRQLSTVSLNLNINPSAVRGIQAATGQLQGLNNALQLATANANSLNAALANLGTSIGNAARGMNTLGGGLNNVNNQINAVRRNTQQGAAGMEEFGRQSALAVRRFAAFSVATGGIYALIRAISSGYSEFLQFNKELVRLQQVTGGTANSLQGISNEITRLSTSLGVTSNDLLNVSSTLAQAGLSATETKTALEALAKSALAPSFDNLNDTVEGSIALMRQFGISANDLESSLGSINAVAAAFAVESGDIIKAIQRTGGVFASASKGVTEGKDALNEFISVFTSVRQTTRESAETIATGLRTIFTRIQRGGTIQALKEYGIVLTDLEGKFVGTYEAVRRLSEGLKQLDPRDLRFSQIVEELGGFRQIGKVIPLIQEFATAQQALTVAQRGAGSLAEAAATAQGSLAIKITKVREEFIALIRDIGQSDSFQNFVDISLQLASALISVASAAKNVLPALAALAAIRSIPAIGQFVGGFGRGLTRRNQGGPIRRFATGGFVPGSGNSDTVPAMLTPGEFVIRKKAVQSIGLNNLQNINKYSRGGSVSKFARGGRASRRMGVFDFDMTTGITKQKETPSLSGFRDPKLAVPDILSASPTILVQLMKKYGASQILTARSGGPKGEMKSALGSFFKRNGVILPESRITTLGDQVGSLGTAEKKARALYAMVKKYGSVDFFDDDQANIDAAKMVRGVSARKVSVMKNLGGIVQKFAQPIPTPESGRVKQLPYYKDRSQVKGAIRKTGGSVRMFGLAGIGGGAGKGSAFNQTLLAKPKGMDPVPVSIRTGTLSKENSTLATNIDSQIKKQFGTSIKSTAKQLASLLKSKIKSPVPFEKIINNSGFQQVVGSVFEGALNMIGAPFFEKTESTKSMDFPNGLGQAASLFKIPGNIPTDATRTVGSSGKGPGRMINQIERYLEAENKGLYTQQPIAKVDKGISKFLLSRMQSSPESVSEKVSKINNELKARNIQIGRTGVVASVTEKQLKTALTRNTFGGLSPAIIQVIKTLYDMPTKRAASGGSISGEDTVPALLTPGEFVINKKAAKRIGSAKLNKLNKADKIQGFNKGGAVGGIQSFASGGGVQEFAVGGIVSAMTSLVKSLPQLASAVANSVNRMRGIPRNIPQGGGWTTATGRVAPLPGRDRDGEGMMRSMGLMFIGPMIAEAINSSISKNFGQTGAVIGSGVSSVISGAAVGSALGTTGALVGAAVGLASAFLDAESAANAYIKAQNEVKIETESSKLEQSLANLASKAKVTAEDLLAIGGSVTEIVNLASSNREIIQQEAGGGRLGWFQRTLMSNFGGGQLDAAQISRELLASSQAATSAVARSLQTGPTQGVMTQQALRQQGINLNEDTAQAKEIKRSLALLQGGAEVTKLEARRIQVAEDVTLDKEGKAAILKAIDQNITNTIDRLSQEYIKNRDAIIQSQAAVKAVTADVDLFAQTIKRLGAFINRASAEFDEAGRQREIATSAGLGEARIVGPSRLDENILSNPIAYSVEELTKALDRTSKTLGFSPELTQKVKTSAVAQQTLESELPRILLQAAKTQQTPGGEFDQSINDQLDEVFKPIREALGGEVNAELLDKYLNDIVTNLQKSAMSLQGKNFEEIASSVPEFAQILKPLSEITQGVGSSLKAYNDMLASTNTEMNNFTNHIGRILDLQMQAASIQLEGANNLKQALGESLSVSQLNKPFDTMIETLTSTQGPNGLVRGTGTLDPAEIARRLSQADKELADAQRGGQKPGETLDDFYNRITKAKTTVDRLSKAQEMLANNTTKASNALNRIRELRQTEESRRNTFDDVLRNINNPQWLMNFTDQVRSLERVQSGRGTMRDIPGAIDALEKRIAGMDPQKQKAEREKFYNNIAEILRKAGVDPAVIKDIKGLIGVGGPDARMNEAIGQYNEAIKAQTDATLFMADRMESSSDIFFNTIIDAAEAFLRKVREGAQDLRPPPGMGVDNNPIGGVVASTGGLIYANKGRLVDFKPKGSDTVPAMLTPGEFVVNAKATKKNMGLLKAINNSGQKGFSKGGIVYMNDGGLVTPELEAILKDLYESPEVVTSSEDLGQTLSEVLQTRGEEGLYNELRKHQGKPYGATPDQSDMLYDFITKYENKQRQVENEKARTAQASERDNMAKSFGYQNTQEMETAQQEFNKKQINDLLSAYDLSWQDFDPSNNINISEERLNELRSGKAGRLTAQESEALSMFTIDKQSKDRQKKIQEEYNKNMQIVQQSRNELEAQNKLDQSARAEINPYTGKNFTGAAEKAAVEARSLFDGKTFDQIAKEREQSQAVVRRLVEQSKKEKLTKQIPDTVSLDKPNLYSMYGPNKVDPLTGADPRMANLLNEAQDAEFLRMSQQLMSVASGGAAAADKIQIQDLEKKHGAAIGTVNGNVKFMDGFTMINATGPTSGELAMASIDFIPMLGSISKPIAAATKTFGAAGKQVSTGVRQIPARLSQVNANMVKPRMMSAQDIADAEAAEVIVNTITKTASKVGGAAKTGALKGVDLTKKGLMTAGDLTSKAVIGGAKATGKLATSATKATVRTITGTMEDFLRSQGIDISAMGSYATNFLRKFSGVDTQNILRDISTIDWLESLKKQSGLSKTKPLEDLIATGRSRQPKAPRTTTPKPPQTQPRPQTVSQKKFKPQEESFDLGDDVAEEVNKVLMDDGRFVSDEEYSRIMAERLAQQAATRTAQAAKTTITGITEPKMLEKARTALASAQQRARDIMMKFASSPEKAQEIMEKQDELFSIAELAVDPTLKSKVNAVSGESGRVGALYRSKTRSIAIPSTETLSSPGLLTHEVFHGVQRNIGTMSGGKNAFKWLQKDSLQSLQPQMDEFLKPGGAYEKLVKDLGGKTGGSGFYNAENLKKSQFELFTTLGQAAETEAFMNNVEAQNMFRAIIKAMGYKKGGVVYASQGKLVPYQPKGTDTVPAMLTPGEFVVNARATKKNLGLLKAINGGAKGYSKGGVAYLEDGGVVDDDQRRLEEIITTAKNDRDAFFYTMKNQIFDSYGLTGMVRIGPDGKENMEDDWMYQVGKEYGANQMGSELWNKLAPDEQKRIALEHKAYFDQKIQKLSEEARRERINGKTGMDGQDFRWTDTETYEREKAEAENRVANYQREIDSLRQKIATKKQEADSVTQPQIKAKNEAQAQQAEQKDKPQEAAKPTLSETAKTALESVKVNRDALLNATVSDEAIRAKDNMKRELNVLASEGFIVDSSSIRGIMDAAEEQILEARNNNLASLQNFYEANVLPVLGDLANQAGVQPSQPPPQPPAQPQPDPYAGMNQRQRMLAMREAEYEASQQAKREAFRTRTGRDPKTGRIGGSKVELTPEEKALNSKRAEIRAKRAALDTSDMSTIRAEIDLEREFEETLSPEQIANRKRAQRLALGAIDPKQRTESQQERYNENRSEFLASLSPDQIANRERSERIALDAINPDNRSSEQQERLDILKTPLDKRSPEQIARLEELRKEKEQALYASKGRLINYQPRGTDTVPAMLTPGEFVVNRKATKNNLSLLKAINSGNYNTGGIVNPLYLSNGTDSSSGGSPLSLNGVSIPLDTGSFDSGVDRFGSSVDLLSSAIGQFVSGGADIANALTGFNNVVDVFKALSSASALLSGTASGLTNAISLFNTSVSRMNESLSGIPDTISLNVTGSIPVNVTVTVNGGEGLDEKLSSFEDAIYNEIASEVARATAGKNQIKLNFKTSRK